MKTSIAGFALLLATAPLAAQVSPLQLPIPKSPPRETARPRVLLAARELAGLLAQRKAIPLDARGAGPYARAHLPRAVPLWSPAEERSGGIERLRSLLAARGITSTTTVVLYGDADREATAHRFWRLRWAGCSDVRILAGDLAAWIAAGGRLEAGSPRRRARNQPWRTAATSAVVDSTWVADSYGEAGVELLDVRDARGWQRWQTPAGFAAGHIPYSLPFDPRSFLPAAGGWPDPSVLRRELSKLGPRPDDPVDPESTFVVYGADSDDPRIGLGYLLLALAGFEARVFPGGWREWMAAGGRPIVRVVTATEVAALLKRENPGLDRDQPPTRAILLDLRDPRDFAIGHLPGARDLPFLAFPVTFEIFIAGGWPGADKVTTPLILYCFGIECVRSRKASALAARAGFRDVLWFRGGVREWREAGLPLPKTISPAATASPAVGAARRLP